MSRGKYYMNDNEMYEDIPTSVFCNDCMCDVPTDSFGEPACKQCNPQYDPEMRDEDGNIKELDFHDATLKPFDKYSESTLSYEVARHLEDDEE